MDWDDLACNIAGPEGGLRYVRLGIVLVVLGIVAMAAIGFTPVFRSNDTSLTYDMMAEDPEGEAFNVPNSHALGHARWALIGSGLTMLMGLVMVLEGRRVINLRRLLPWHAEARASALFSLAAFLASIGLVAAASLQGLAMSMPTGTGDGLEITVQASSPAALVALATMGLAVIGMLGMAYYNCVLSVYRGGGEPRNRRMARFTIILGLASLASVILLRMGAIMSVVVPLAFGPDTVVALEFPFTMSRIGHQAVDGGVHGTLNAQLVTASVLLFLSFLTALSGLVGTSARSQGGSSLRVRRAASLPTTSIILVAIALLMLAWASTKAPEAARDALFAPDEAETYLGWGLLFGVVLAIGALAGALGYLRGLGMEYAREALAFWKRPEISRDALEEAEEEGIPQPMLDQALAEEARAAGALPAGTEAEPPSVETRGGRFAMGPRKMQMLLVVVMIVLIILLAVLFPRGPGGGNGPDGSEPVDIPSLPTFSEEYVISEYLAEGADMNFGALATTLSEDADTSVYFVDTVSLRLAWLDEPDAGVRWTNQVDTFRAGMEDAMSLDSVEGDGTNPRGGEGTIILQWRAGDGWVAHGNTDLVDWGQQTVHSPNEVVVMVQMALAGDQVTILGRTQTDAGNAFTLTVTVDGHLYTQGSDGQ